MVFDTFLDQLDVEKQKYYYCMACRIPMILESKDKLDRPKFKCPKCGAVYNTAY